MKEPISYKKAVAELDEILNTLENAEPDVDQMAQKVRRATELIKYCKQKLSKTDAEIQAIFEEMKDI